MIRLRHALVHSGSAWESIQDIPTPSCYDSNPIEPRGGVQVLYVTELSGSELNIVQVEIATRGGVQVLYVTELSAGQVLYAPGLTFLRGSPATRGSVQVLYVTELSGSELKIVQV